MKLALTVSLVGLIALSGCTPCMTSVVWSIDDGACQGGTSADTQSGSNDTATDNNSANATQTPPPSTTTETTPVTNQEQTTTVISSSDGKVAYNLYGFGKLKFGFSVNQAFSVDPTLELTTENSFTFLGTVTAIDGISFVERVFFSGTPAKMDYVNLQYTSTEDPTQKIVADLSNKYGEPKISDSSIVPGDDSYEWYFLNGATISVANGIVSYDSPQQPLPTKS